MSIHHRLTAARHAALALIEHTLVTATDAILAGDASPATLREARIAATASVRALDALERTLSDEPDELAEDPSHDPAAAQHDQPEPRGHHHPAPPPPVPFTHADLLASLGVPLPPPAPRSHSPAAILDRAGQTRAPTASPANTLTTLAAGP